MVRESSPKWVAVIEFVAAVEAEVIMSVLLGAGVRARLIQESVARLYGFDSGPIGGIRIEVLEEDLDAARELLKAADIADEDIVVGDPEDDESE